MSTPAVRIILGQPANIAIGTPLAVIIPTALSGSFVYMKRGLIKKNLFIIFSISGLLGVITGAMVTKLVPPELVMIITAIIVLYLGLVIIGFDARSNIFNPIRKYKKSIYLQIGCGLFSGFYSGFLGLGGGTILIPILVYFFDLDFKESIATSLSIVAFYVFPGALTHYIIGNVRLDLSFWLILGVVPGSLIGAKLMLGRSEKTIKNLFGFFLIAISLYFLYFELVGGKII